jgi:hypothetical protein
MNSTYQKCDEISSRFRHFSPANSTSAMARMRGAGKKIGYDQYRSGPDDVPVYVYVDRSTGETHWSTCTPKVIRVTQEELEELNDEEGYIGENGVKQLCDYTDRVREIVADDLSATNARLEGVPQLPANPTEAQTRKFQEACSKGLEQANWGYGCESCRTKCARCTALSVGESNATMALSFSFLAKSCASDAKGKEEKETFQAVSRSIASAKHRVRSSKDFRAGERDVPERMRRRVDELIDVCAVHGSLKVEYEAQFTRAKLRIGAKGSKHQTQINVLRREDAVFCPSYDVAADFAKLAGLDKKAKYCSQCQERKPQRFKDEEKSGPFTKRGRLWPYVREVQHGYFVVSLDDLDVGWGFEPGEVGEEETLWEVGEARNGGKGTKRGRG